MRGLRSRHPNHFQAECGVGEDGRLRDDAGTGQTKALLCSAANSDVFRRDACRLQALGDIYLPGGGDCKPTTSRRAAATTSTSPA